METFFPPGPMKHFILGNAPEFRADPLRAMSNAADAYGDVVHFRFGPAHAYLVTNPLYAHEVLTERTDIFSDTPNLLRALNSSFGHELFAPKERMSHRERRVILFREDWLTACADEIDLAADTAPLASEPFDVTAWAERLTQAITARFLLNDVSETIETLCQRAPDHALLADRRFVSPLALPLAKVRQATRHVNAALARHMAAERGKDTLLGRLIASAEARAWDKYAPQVRDEAILLLAVGCRSAAHTLAWALWLLGRNPDAEASLRADTSGTYADLVVHETMRLYPPAWIVRRQTVKEARLGSYYLPAGSTVFVSPYIMGRRPRLFTNPDAFLPERFLPGYEARLPRHAYMPFGGGWRSQVECDLVVPLVSRLLTRLTARARWQIVRDAPLRAEADMTLRPSGLIMQAETLPAV